MIVLTAALFFAAAVTLIATALKIASRQPLDVRVVRGSGPWRHSAGVAAFGSPIPVRSPGPTEPSQ